MSRVYEFSVVKSELITPSTLVVTLHDNKRRLPFAFEPGQYAAISYFHHGRPTPARCFSITSSPTDQNYLQFAMRVAGSFTSTAEQTLKEGSRVIVEGPFGSFAFNKERDRSALLLAGGIGVTPFISMLRYASHLKLPNDLMLIYSCRTQDDIPFLDELTQLRMENPNIQVVYAIGSGPTDKLTGQSVLHGRLEGKMLNQITSGAYAGRSYFVCGPPAFMSGVSKTLLDNGAPADSVLTEAFAQGQKSARSIRHNLPLQVYALTGISVTLGAATLLVHDAAATAPTLSKDSSGGSYSVASGYTQNNSRQNAVNQTLGSLQGNSTSGSAAITSGQGDNAASGGTTTAGDSSASGGSTSPTTGVTSGAATSSTTTKSSTAPSGSSTSSTTKTTSGTTTTKSTGSTTSSTGTSGSSTTSSSGSTGSSSSTSSGSTKSTPPPPPALVAPTLTFSASSTTITSGSSITLSWSINANATTPVSCSASGGWSGSKNASGSQKVSPTANTTYNLSCSNSAGTASRYVNITVYPSCVSTPSNPC